MIHHASEKAVEKQHARGKLTARERIENLLDPGTFEELDRSSSIARPSSAWTRTGLGDAVVTGHGKIDGRLVFVFSQDFTVFGGSLAEAIGEKMCKIMDLAMKTGARSSASTTPAARASRKASSRWAAMATSSCATRSRPA